MCAYYPDEGVGYSSEAWLRCSPKMQAELTVALIRDSRRRDVGR